MASSRAISRRSQGGPRRRQGHGKECAGGPVAERRRQQLIGLLDAHHLGEAEVMKAGGGQDEDAGIDEDGEAQGHDDVGDGKADRLAQVAARESGEFGLRL